MRNPKKSNLMCIAYVSAGDQASEWIQQVERKQLNYIKDYAKAHDIGIKTVVHRGELGSYEANRQFEYIIKRIQNGEADGLIVANMMVIAKDIPEAYYKAGRINAAGGRMVTVDEGVLRLRLKTRYGYEGN